MNGAPINLHERRIAAQRRKVDMLRSPESCNSSVPRSAQLHIESLQDQMLEEPARTWVEVMEKWRFLLERYSKSPAAEDDHLKELIMLAVSDMERMKEIEDNRT